MDVEAITRDAESRLEAVRDMQRELVGLQGRAAAAQAAVAGSRIATALAKLAALLRGIAAALKAVKAMKTLSREGIMIKTILVKGLLIKPVVRGATGLTGAPVSEAGQTFVDNLLDMGADEYDDQQRGDTGPRTPLRDAIDDPLRPVAEHTAPISDQIDEVLGRFDDALPTPPGGWAAMGSGVTP